VRQGKEDQQLLALGQLIREAGLGAAHLVQQVGVRQLATLRPSGGTGGVDERRGIGRLDGRAPRVEDPRVHICARRGELVERGLRGAVDPQYLAEFGQFTPELLDRVGVRIGLGEGQHRGGVGEHEAHLLGRRGLVDRHGDRADGQDGEVDDGPLVPRRGQHGHPIARAHPLGDQPKGGRTDLGRDLGAGDVGP
jgi:hypothetical protein